MKKKTGKFIMTVVLYITSGFTQTVNINLTGTVSDAWGDPVAGCSVTPVGVNTSAITTTQGTFEFIGEFTGTVPGWKNREGSVSFSGGVLRFNIENSFSRVDVIIQDTRGRQKLKVIQKTFNQGTYKIFPDAYLASLNPGLYILSVKVDGTRRSYKIFYHGVRQNPNRVMPDVEGERFSNAKRGAANDSLNILCAGSLPQKISTDYSTPVNAIVSPLWDIVVYGGTSAGVIAAVQAVRMQKSVVIVSPDRRLGGLSSGGLGQTDIGNKQAIGGLSRNFYQRIAGKYNSSAESQWTFEPKVALEIFQDHIGENNLPVVYGERLELEGGVLKEGARIKSFRVETGSSFAGKMFIDATYEGDLMAKAGVEYTFGREANSVYDETLNGVQVKHAIYHQLRPGVDPYVIKGDPSSGLLPQVDPTGPGEEGTGDKRIQAYCFRMCLTNNPDNMVPVEKPADYSELEYELFFRHLEQGGGEPFFLYGQMPNGKTDWNNKGGFSTDFIGANYDYPDGDYQTRQRIIQAHRTYTQGWLWVLQHHPRVPEATRDKFIQWGLPKDEYLENGHWTPQLYIREARRMVGQFVMTENHVMQREQVTKSVGMGAYQMDSHQTQRYITSEGFVQNEGDVEVGVSTGPYPIDMGSLLPKKGEADNLLVPVCLSSSHMAFGSIRMEPVFMILGQSAATIAAHSLDEQVLPHEIDYKDLYDRLVADEQVLGVDPPGAISITVDDNDAALTGNWEAGNNTPQSGPGYQHDGNTGKGSATAEFTANLPESGNYEVRFYYPPNSNRASNTPVTVTHSGGQELVQLDQRQAAPGGFILGTFQFSGSGKVSVSNAGTDGYVVIDGVRFVKK